MPDKDDFVVIGKIGATYGIKGWLKIQSFTDSLSNISLYNPWFLETGEHWESYEVSDSRPHGNGWVAKLQGKNTPEQARLLTGKKIAIKRSQLPALKKKEYYWDDLQGLTVIDQNNETLGQVIYLMATGSNDVLVIKGKTELAIPFLLDEVIKSIDLEAKVMHVNWEKL